MDYEKEYKDAMERAKKWGLTHKLCVEDIFPELAESDDERIREEMVRYFTEMKKGGSAALPYDDCIAYLERQKKQKPADEAEKFFDSVESYNQGFVAGQKKMKEDIEKGFGISEHSLDYLAGRYAGYAAARQEQEPAEWSEEDEEILNEMLDHCNTENATWYNWLKSLRPQPKQVWTEEDDRICHLIMANLSESARHAITLPMETVNDFNNWLRTLQYMPPVFTDWNEEDQTLLSDALGCVTMVQELKKRGKLKNFHISCSYDELRSWVRSLKSRPRKQPSWKPSEEQMEAFKDYIEDFQAKAEAAVGGWNNFDVMIELYEQLKKL